MFVIEKFIQYSESKQEAWEHARDKYLDKHDYWSEDEYEERHPRPGHFVKSALKLMLIAVIVALLGLLLFGFIKEVEQNKNNKAEETPISQTDYKNCRNFNKHDQVRIQYGDYVGTTGTIVGGCEEKQHYQVKLDPNQKANIPHDGDHKPVDVGSSVISVDSDKNMVKIELPKEKKE